MKGEIIIEVRRDVARSATHPSFVKSESGYGIVESLLDVGVDDGLDVTSKNDRCVLLQLL